MAYPPLLPLVHLAPVVQTLDSAIQRLNNRGLRVNIIFTFLFFFKQINKGKKKIRKKNNAIKAWQNENLKITKYQLLVSYTYTLQVFRFSTLYSRPCCIKKYIIKTRGYNRNYWDPEEVDPKIGCMVLSVHHMWVEFVVGPLLCSERFLSGYSGFPLSSKTNIFQIPIRPGIR